MSNKERFKEIKNSMGYIVKDGQYYRFIYYDVGNDLCKYVKYDKHLKANEINTLPYEQASKLHNIEVFENAYTPDQLFLSKVDNSDNGEVINLLTRKSLTAYIRKNRDDCTEVIEKIRELVQTHGNKSVRRAAYRVCESLQLDNLNELKKCLKQVKEDEKERQRKPSTHRSKLYNPPVGEFGFCCEEEKMVIVFSHLIRNKWEDYRNFEKEFKSRYPYEASLVDDGQMKELYEKYREYHINGTLKEFKEERWHRINDKLPKEIVDVLKKYRMRATRADGRGTTHRVSKCRRKKQYDQDRLSGYRLISLKKGIPVAGKRFELYKEDVEKICHMLDSGEINLDEILAKEQE